MCKSGLSARPLEEEQREMKVKKQQEKGVGDIFDLCSKFSSASASNRNSPMNIHEWREESAALRCRE